jgi:hypothetical protein
MQWFDENVKKCSGDDGGDGGDDDKPKTCEEKAVAEKMRRW